MSRIGSKPIKIPEGVTVTVEQKTVICQGPKGKLEQEFRSETKVNVENKNIIVERTVETPKAKALHGLYRSLLANMIQGVNTGWNKGLEMIGTGFRAETDGKKLTLRLGFSHPVIYEAPEGISFEVKENKINITGIDKQMVGEIASQIRRIKPPEPYKGKGIRYVGEVVRRKPGKAAAKAGVGGTAGAAGAGATAKK